MISSGSLGMPLHFGKVPAFLINRMGEMGEAIVESIVDNYGTSEVLTRMSDPNWFQALGAVMGMHWNSSGVTATVLGSLKQRINPKEFRQTIHHLDVLQVFIGNVKGGLTAFLQRVHQGHLKVLQLRNVMREFFAIKRDLTVAPFADISQLPLARRLRDLPADVAVHRIARQNDLGAA